MSKEIFNKGIQLGREQYTHIRKRGSKWKSRHIPVFIRKHLMVPYYLIESGANYELWIINYPMDENGKVAFVLFATLPYEASEIYVSSKQTG